MTSLDVVPFRRFSLRLTISGLVVGLLVATVAGVVLIALLIRAKTIQTTAEALGHEISARIADKVAERFGPLKQLLLQFRDAAERGVLPVGDDRAMVERLAQRVRFDPRMEWLAFIRPGGKGGGAVRRPDGTILVIHREPGTKDGVVVELWQADGSRGPAPQLKVDLSGIQRGAWYKLGAESNAPAWTQTYVRPFDGKPGRACAVALRRDDAIVGVFALGFGVEFLRDYVAGLRAGRTGRVFTVHPVSGKITLSPDEKARQRMGPAVDAAVRALPRGVAGLEPGRPHSIAATANGVAYRVGIGLHRPTGMPPWIHAIVVPEDELVGYLQGFLAAGLGGVLLLLGVATLLAHLLSRRVSRPLRNIAKDLRRVGEFELHHCKTPPSRIHEIAVVASATERMKASLRSFSRYVPTDLVRDLLHQGSEAKLGGVERPLTLFFSDVQGFTSLSEGVAPARLVSMLGDYLDVVARTVQRNRGTIDKFIGDGVLAFFNAPRDDQDHAAHACGAALDLQAELAALTPRWEAAGRPAFPTRIGLHTDNVVVGNIGTPDRFAYTVIGDGVNLAARIESLNKTYGTWILASAAVRRQAAGKFVWRRIDRTVVVGRTAGSDVFELLGRDNGLDDAVLEARDVYEMALGRYFERDFAKAAAGFARASDLLPDDRAAKVLFARAEAYAHQPPPEDWNGIFVQTQK